MSLSDPYDSGPSDPAEWSSNCHCHLPVDDMEPLTADAKPYREASLSCLRVLIAVDAFMHSSRDPRLAWCVVSKTLELHSLAGISVRELAHQLGVAVSTVVRALARFREMAGLDAGEGCQLIGLPARAPGARE